jgi:hypothetical protein
MSDHSVKGSLPGVMWSVLSKSEKTCLPIHIGTSLYTEKRTGMWYNADCLAPFAIKVNMMPGDMHA